MGEGICKFCGKPIWKDTDGWRHESSGSMPICNSIPEPRDGKTLADFADSEPGKLFKRPMHGNPYSFRGGQLREIRRSPGNECADWPRLTAEDLTATDWQEV